MAKVELSRSLQSSRFSQASRAIYPSLTPKHQIYASKAKAYRPLRQRIVITTALAQTRAKTIQHTAIHNSSAFPDSEREPEPSCSRFFCFFSAALGVLCLRVLEERAHDGPFSPARGPVPFLPVGITTARASTKSYL